MHIAKAIVIDTCLFFKNSMIYKIHVHFKTRSLVQLMHSDLNVFSNQQNKIQNQYMKGTKSKTLIENKLLKLF